MLQSSVTARPRCRRKVALPSRVLKLRHRGSCVTEVVTVKQELDSRFSARVYKGEACPRLKAPTTVRHHHSSMRGLSTSTFSITCPRKSGRGKNPAKVCAYNAASGRWPHQTALDIPCSCGSEVMWACGSFSLKKGRMFCFEKAQSDSAHNYHNKPTSVLGDLVEVFGSLGHLFWRHSSTAFSPFKRFWLWFIEGRISEQWGAS